MRGAPLHLLAPLTPRPTPAAPGALAALQHDRQRSSMVWLLAGVVAAHHASLALLGSAGTGDVLWAVLIALVTVAMLAIGGAQLVLLLRAATERRDLAATVGVLALVGLLIAPFTGLLVILFGMLHALVPLAVAAAGLVLLVLGPRRRRTGTTVDDSSSTQGSSGARGAFGARGRPWLAAALGALGVAVVIGLGVLDALVLLPLTLVPSMTLAEIYAALAAAGEDGGTWVPLAWAALWFAAIAMLAAGLVRARADRQLALGLLLALPSVALLGLQVAEFSIGMGLTDSIAERGGMSSGFGPITLVVVLLTALAAAFLIAAGPQRSPREHAIRREFRAQVFSLDSE